ncbi:hypothetical protein BJX63DRAFT_156957 [Aspergillus granulosus]|uniref:Pentatricopeptide repeat protein n=1 Tax=Aspergillus granulosus TaxID=176169 RepID=A0ABR4HJQ5_9EURO
MFRCSHVTALRTQFIPSAALRSPLSSPWAIAPRSCSLLAPAPKTAQTVTPRTALSQSRLYSTELDEGNDQRNSHWDVDDEFEEPRRKATPAFKRDTRDLAKKAKIHGPWVFRKRKAQDHLVQVATGKGEPANRKMIQMELKWIKDRVQLAQRVRRLLNNDDIGFAAALVHAAQIQGLDCAASWNEILGYCMDKGSPVAAWKFWNKMKKLGNRPTAYSYTIMLHGISQNERYPGFHPMDMALKIYRGVEAPNSTVKPSIIIGNAMLGVCSRHNDMDTLWEIAGELPEEGPGSPDDVTYTIILNAIRGSVQKAVESLRTSTATTKDMVRRRRLLGVAEGKKIWRDVVYRWKKGEIQMKDQLVAAMTGILLEGPEERHLYEVFKLYQQTTGIPDFSGTPGDTLSMRLIAHRNSLVFGTVEDVPFVDVAEERTADAIGIKPEGMAEVQEEERGGFQDVFEPVVAWNVEPYLQENGNPPATPSKGPMYMPISNRTLTRILDVALLTNDFGAIGKRYWDHLTQDAISYRITPDTLSGLAYLRILRLTRSTKRAVGVIREKMVPTGNASGVIFHIGMSVCRRDRKNFNILLLANELIALMDKSLVLPDARAVTGYIVLINFLADSAQLLPALKGLDEEKQNLASDKSGGLQTVYRQLRANLLLVAIETIRPAVSKLKTALEEVMNGPPARARGFKGAEKNSVKVFPQGCDDIILVLQRTRQLIDSALENATEHYPSKEILEELKKESLGLRKYSNALISEKYGAKRIYPTEEQKRDFVARTKVDADTEVQSEAEELSSEQFPPFKFPESQLPESQSSELPSQEHQPRLSELQETQYQNTQPQETQAEKPNLQEIQVDESQLSELRSEETQSEDSPSEKIQPQQSQPQDLLPEETQVEKSQSQERSSESRSETPLSQETPSEEPRPDK